MDTENSMINISDADKALWKGDSVHKSITISIPGKNITLTNEDLKSESMILTESINDARNLTFQGCIASRFEVTIINFIQDIRGEYIEVTMSAGDSETIPIFAGYVDTQSNMNHEDFTTNILAFDPLKQVIDRDVTSWYNGLTFPMSIKNFRDAFFTYVGIPQATVLLTNDGLMLNKSYADTNITGGELLRDLCQLNGVFGQYGRDKQFHYLRLISSIEAVYPSTDLYPSENLFPSEANAQERVLKSLYKNISYQPFHTYKISRVIIVSKDGTIAGSYGDTTDDTLYIHDNQMAWGVIANQACQNVLSAVKGIDYTPATVECKGLPYVECGDIITANTRINVIQSYVLTRTLKGIHALSDEFDSDSDQYREPYKVSTQTKISTNTSKTAIAQSSAERAQDSASAADTKAGNAQGAASEADRKARNAQGTADNAVYRVSLIEADYVKTGTIEAVNGRIDNLSARTVKIENAYINRAECNTIASNAITTKLATLQALAVSGKVTANSFAIGATTFTTKQANVRLANGGTKLMTYLGF